MGNSRNGKVSGRVLVAPSINRMIAPVGAPEIVDLPLTSVSAERLVPLMLAVALAIGWSALSSTMPVTTVFAGFLGVTAEARNVASAPGRPVTVAETALLLMPSCSASVSTVATRPSSLLTLVTDVPPSSNPPPCSTLRSEEHTSELQSPDHLVCRLLLEKKKKFLDRRIYCAARFRPAAMLATFITDRPLARTSA